MCTDFYSRYGVAGGWRWPWVRKPVIVRQWTVGTFRIWTLCILACAHQCWSAREDRRGLPDKRQHQMIYPITVLASERPQSFCGGTAFVALCNSHITFRLLKCPPMLGQAAGLSATTFPPALFRCVSRANSAAVATATNHLFVGTSPTLHLIARQSQ